MNFPRNALRLKRVSLRKSKTPNWGLSPSMFVRLSSHPQLTRCRRRQYEMPRRLRSALPSNMNGSTGAAVEDVSNPHIKKGFDLQSRRPNGEVRYIEVKGRTGIASVELTANEWRQAANHRDRYWLYVVYYCDANPQLYRCRDPFGNLIAKAKGSVIINASDIMRESVS